MNILEVTEYDLYGRTFNGFDVAKQINASGKHTARMKALRKISTDPVVEPIIKLQRETVYSDALRRAENEILNMMSVLSVSSPALYESEEYRNADIVHYHQFHNANLGFFELEKQGATKPTVISFHDPWMMTGRCVHPLECEGFKNGCQKCEKLETLFSFKEDMSAKMWKIKRDMFMAVDPDIIVHSEYMYDLVKANPYTKNLNVHLIPFGIDVEEFDIGESKARSRKIWNIPEDDYVMFFREQADFKGTEYIVKALERIEHTGNITLLTCSQKGLLSHLKNKFNIVEIGNVDRDTIKRCYNACDVFLMPSTGESFGMMALEAMASGKPVIVFDNTALPYVTHAPEIGVLVKNLDADDLYEKITFLMNNKEEGIRRGKLGRQLAKEKHSPAEYERKMNAAYEAAYNRQKDKLQKKAAPLQTENFADDINVAKLEYHLKAAAQNVFGRKAKRIKPLCGDEPIKCSPADIDFEDEKVKEAVIVFNKECYALAISNRFIHLATGKIRDVTRSVFRFPLKLIKKAIKK